MTTIKTADSVQIEINDVPSSLNHAMKPYIDIVDSIKASEMSKMNFPD